MTVLHHEIRIEASAERVWEVLANLEAVQQYNPTVLSARYLTEQRGGVGAARECRIKPKGVVKERVTAWTPQTAIEIELYESPWPLRFMRWRTVLRPESGGTRVVQDMRYRVKFGPLGMLLDALMMRRTLDRAVAGVFQGLRQYVEARGAPSPAQPGGLAAAPGRR
jgi:uncharacterized protein YndB with AHSA1/START domain